MRSPVRYLTDAQYRALPVHERALHVARKHDRVREATGKNDGFWVSAFLKAAGLVGRYPWCAAYAYYCLREAGWEAKGPKHPASTYFWWEWARDSGRLIKPNSNAALLETIKRGDLFVWNGKGGGHIGFVLRVLPDGSFLTLEGNTNKAGSREGDGVYDRVRHIKTLRKYPRWGFIRV
jgi:hypothetical protein